jgi:hypothetical protein
MSQTHSSLAAQLLEAGTCLNLASNEVLHLAEEVLGTRIAFPDPTTKTKVLNDVNKAKGQNDLVSPRTHRVS